MRPLLRLLRLYRPAWGWIGLGMAVAVAAVLANVALMAVSGWFVTAMAAAGAAGASLNYLTPAAVIRALAILRSGGRYAERLATHEAVFRLIASLRVWLFDRIEPQPLPVLAAYRSADLGRRLRGDVDRLETAYLRLFAPLVMAVLAGAAVVAWLAGYSPLLAAIEGLALALAGAGVPLLLARRAARLGRRQVRLAADLTVAAVEGRQGLAELLAFGAAARHADRLLGISARLVARQTRRGRLEALTQAFLSVAANGALWCAVVVTVPLLRQGRLDGPQLVMLCLAALAAFEAVAPLPVGLLAVGEVIEAVRRLLAVADHPVPPPAATAAAPFQGPCDIRVEGLRFGFGGRAPLFDGLDVDLPQGGRLALVGPVGSGKSTLILLLTGLLQPDAGTIRFNGRPGTAFDPETLRRCFAVAPQEAGLFSGTLAEALRLGRPEAEDAALRQALAAVRLDDFVAALPAGLATPIGEGGIGLSGGQARRLSIARALLKPAPVVVLDEPGEGLDYRTEREVLAGVTASLGGRSLLLITHRTAGLDLVDGVVRLPAAPKSP